MVVLDRTRLTGQLIFYKTMTLEDYIRSIQHNSIAVIGAGISNLPWIYYLLDHHCKVIVCDKRGREELGETAERMLRSGASLRLGEHYLDNLREDIIYRTPGLMPFDQHLVSAQQAGSHLTSEMEVFLSLCPCRVIAVTGSDGKTTTTTIISELLKEAGYRVHIGGNIGRPLLCSVDEMKAEDMAVLELSSFQLHSMFCKPDVAVITNLTPNHLDKHLDMQDYIDAKSNIFLNQDVNDRLVLNYDDPHTEYYAGKAPSTVSYFSSESPVANGFCCRGKEIYRISGGRPEYIMSADEIRIPGAHNVKNYLAAFEAVRGLVPDDVYRIVARRFSGVPHRLEEVRVLHGVTYINDSIASSPSRTIAGLHALPTKPIIICGGYDKHLSFETLGMELRKNAKAVFLTGATAGLIAEAITSSYAVCHDREYGRPPVTMVSDFKEAVLLASRHAESGDIVILSPACASFDHFHNFEERGNYFKEIVMELSS